MEAAGSWAGRRWPRGGTATAPRCSPAGGAASPRPQPGAGAPGPAGKYF